MNEEQRFEGYAGSALETKQEVSIGKEHPSRRDVLLYWFFAVSGALMVFCSFWIRTTYPNSVWVDLLLNVGATLISTAVLSFLYQRFGSENLIHQITEMRRSLRIAQRGLDLGLRDMWREQRDIPNNMWNVFTASAQSEVSLFGVAELGYAADPAFHRIVSNMTLDRYRENRTYESLRWL